MGEPLRKITSKDVLGYNFKEKSAPTVAMALYSVMGRVKEVVSDRTQYGSFFKFLGIFEATKYETGEIYIAPVCILPEPVGTLIGTALWDMQQKTARKIERERVIDGKQVKVTETVYDPLEANFAYEIGVKPNKTPMRFEWTAKQIVAPQQDDPLAPLRDQVKKLLPAPTVATAVKK